MGRADVAKFLLKALLFLVAGLLLWSRTGVGVVYHHAVAGIANLLACGGSMPSVHGVRFDGGEFVARLSVMGQHGTAGISAREISLNVCALTALYLATPVRINAARLARYFLLALGVLFVAHVVMVLVYIDAAIGWRVAEVGGNTGTRSYASGGGLFALFYETVGMYLLVIVLWVPYLFQGLRRKVAGG